MSTYYYFKSSPIAKTKEIFSFWPVIWRFFPAALITMGTIFLINALMPIVLYEFKSLNFGQRFVSPVVISGIPAEMDYSNPTNWFSVVPELPPKVSKITHYSLSIPKLGIEDSVVQIGGKDLMESLIHYPGTALPGQYGNVVIFGHSVLPQFFNPKSYKTIFSTLPTLKEKDEILLSFDGVVYRYLVTELVETTPDDITILEQRYDDRYVSLITCVPPGTYLRRLLVRAKLVTL